MSIPISSLALLVAQLDARNQLIAQGWAAINTLHSSLEEAQRALGVQITYDPTSDPSLVQYIAVGTINGCEGAAKGALLGLLFGALLGAPRDGLLLGAVFGGVVGVAQGVDAVARGWRVHIAWDASGSPRAVVVAA